MENNVNKVVVDGIPVIDLTGDTVDAAHLAEGYTAHDKTGKVVVGAMPLSGGDVSAKDFVVTESHSFSGHDYNWAWRVWNSGIVEAWIATTVTPAESTQTGSNYFSEVFSLHQPGILRENGASVPFTPKVITGTANASHWIINPSGSTDEVHFRLCRSMPIASSVDVYIYVMGTLN